jgi:4-amino-4-deoxy-L-arabinose transferase-like glycosyltransferase
LPGYPAFLAAIWSITGVEHYTAVLIVQALVDVAACYLAADLTLRTTRSPRAARIAFLLAVLCPFTANYTACVLTETLSIFFTALALDCAVLAADSTRIKHWAACGVAVTAGMLLRPDGGMMLAIVLAFVLLRAASSVAGKQPLTDLKRRLLPSVVICAVVLAAFVPWTVRNWRDFHVFQPLAPRYANSPNEFVPLGFQRWVKTWMADYTSVAEIYWSQGEGPLEIEKMPDRAFDSTEEREQTDALFDSYNSHRHVITRDLDRQFGELARQRIRRHPIRYYVSLPALRIADMWLRPRTEMLGITDHWWEFKDDPAESIKAMTVGAINLLYVGAALLAGLLWIRRPRLARYWGLLLAFVVVRSLFLGSIENPEPRYTLECYPVVIVLAATAVAGRKFWRRQEATPTPANLAEAGTTDADAYRSAPKGESLIRN